MPDNNAIISSQVKEFQTVQINSTFLIFTTVVVFIACYVKHTRPNNLKWLLKDVEENQSFIKLNPI